jgi:predicted extracellular nuclease
VITASRRRGTALALFALAAALFVQTAAADTAPQTLPFTQNWSNTSLITANDNWSAVPGIIGYRGDGMLSATGVNPQTVLADGSTTPVNVIANQASPNTLTTGGVAEFEIANPVVALQGSGTARVPHLVLTLNTTGLASVRVEYNLRDIDGSADNAVQPVALQYRVGTSGNYTNVPAGFVADATTGPNEAALVTFVSAPLPAAAAGEPVVQVRILTTDAAGSDEWVGIDDLSVTGSAAPEDAAPSVLSTSPANGATDVPVGTAIGVQFSEPVTLNGAAVSLTCGLVTQAFTVSGGPETFTLTPTVALPHSSSCSLTIPADAVSDVDTNDPPDGMAAPYAFSFTTAAAGPVPGSVVVSEVYGGGGNAGATLTHDFIELYNRTGAAISLAGWSVQYAAATGSAWQVTPLTGSIPAGRNYLVQEAQGAGGTEPLPTPDAIGTIPMSATAGKVALVASTTALTGACPASGLILDFVGFGTTANCFEGSGPTPTLSNTTSAQRKQGGQQDTDSNADDFEVGTPDPRASGDQAPRVSATTPAAGAAGVARTANISVTFSEPVNVSGSWFTISCSSSGPHTASVSGGPTTFTLDPDADFAVNETCTVTILAANVSDQDTEDPPDTMAENYVFSFQTEDILVCGDPATKIHAVQGPGASTPLAGQPVTIEGVVVGDYQTPGVEFGGFYLQEETADQDADPLTSEGIFVFDNGFGVDVAPGDVVRVRGTATEFSGLTQVASVNGVALCASGTSVPATPVAFPVSAVSDHERFEGMLVRYTQSLTVAEVFNLGRFGEVSLSGAGRLYTPTAVVLPGAPAQGKLDENNRNRIILDDGNNQQNIDPTRYPQGGLSASNTLRVGDTLPSGIAGVMDFRFSAYRLQPVGPISFAHSNPRTPAPEPVGGNLKVASFNVLNYFNGDGMGGGFPTARGATTPFELERQTAKEVSALTAMNADIVGLMEMENDSGPQSALADLVRAMNAAAGPGTYGYVDTGVIGGDEIKVALMYKPASVTPVGTWKIITSAVDPRFDTSLNRPSLAQTFEHAASGERFTVVVSHLKSKGSACAGDPDTGDGQGNCNQTRNRAAAALVDWLATDPTGSGDPDYLLIGDMNSYTFEDPIRTFEVGGFMNMIRHFHGLTAYSYVFNGESGYLDHALASPSLAPQVSGATDWHINPDEPTVLDYNVEFKTANQVTTFYDPGPYRSSDHDPVLVGLALNEPPTANAGGPYAVEEGGYVTLSATGTDPEGGALTYAWDIDGNGTFETPGQTPTFGAGTLDGPSGVTVTVRVTDAAGKSATATATVEIVNAAPTGTLDAPASALAGFPFTLAASGVTDPSAADTAAGFEYAFDCGAGYGSFAPAPSASCPTSLTGTLSVGVRIRDKDGGENEYRASVEVVVTFDSLCALTRSYSSDPKLADRLCDKLAKAEKAKKEKQQQKELDAYRKEVEHHTDDPDKKPKPKPKEKPFAADEGALLVELSREL